VSELSIYDVSAPKLLALGYYPLSIGPGTKKPQHYVPSERLFVNTDNWTRPARPPEASPQPGAGAGVRLGEQPDGTYVIGLDWDTDEAAIAAMDRFPATVTKEGQRGFTAFYRSAKPIATRGFLGPDKRPLMQVLSTGTQSVIPPSVHKDTGRPYTWTSEFTLYNCRPGDLVELPEDYLARIEKILLPLGYEPEPQGNGHLVNGDDGDGGESPFKELNRLALQNLGAWVPTLGLYGCRRKKGRYDGYDAVATWRPSSTGRPTEKRKLNLSISRAGITDFGTHQGYSSIDLVMRARECSRSDAMVWLDERVRVEKGPEVDFDRLIEGNGADKLGARPVPPPSLGTAWFHGDPVPADGFSDTASAKAPYEETPKVDNPDEVPEWWGPGGWCSTTPRPQIPWLVEGTIPLVGTGLISGQTGAAKTWIATNLSACALMGKSFAGMHVGHPGGVLYFEVENSNIDVRIRGACEALGGRATELPFLFSETLLGRFLRAGGLTRHRSKFFVTKFFGPSARCFPDTGRNCAWSALTRSRRLGASRIRTIPQRARPS
jgi:AAA domain/Bifunctional DNA primase/polymerase, N-terminal